MRLNEAKRLITRSFYKELTQLCENYGINPLELELIVEKTSLSKEERIKRVKKMYDHLAANKPTRGAPREVQIKMINGFIKKYNLDWKPL